MNISFIGVVETYNLDTFCYPSPPNVISDPISRSIPDLSFVFVFPLFPSRSEVLTYLHHRYIWNHRPRSETSRFRSDPRGRTRSDIGVLASSGLDSDLFFQLRAPESHLTYHNSDHDEGLGVGRCDMGNEFRWDPQHEDVAWDAFLEQSIKNYWAHPEVITKREQCQANRRPQPWGEGGVAHHRAGTKSQLECALEYELREGRRPSDFKLAMQIHGPRGPVGTYTYLKMEIILERATAMLRQQEIEDLARAREESIRSEMLRQQEVRGPGNIVYARR
ncbi:hypothetical protein ACS0TY_034667 [Phlomoides rotata]